MPRPLRFIPPGSFVEITARTIHGRLLLRPSPEVNDLVLGVMGRAQQMYGMALHAFSFLSNHTHLDTSPESAQQLAAFMDFVLGNIAREIGRLHDWRDKFWGRRYRAIVVAPGDVNAMQSRFRYVLAQGCPEGLIASPSEWPGVTSVRALTHGEKLEGTWYDRSAEYRARQSKQPVNPMQFAKKYEIQLAPPPCWADRSESERRDTCQKIVAEITEQTARDNKALGRTPMGVARILAQDPHTIPRHVDRSPAPLVHASTKQKAEEFKAEYRNFAADHHDAAVRQRAGELGVPFPEWSFPSPRPFCKPPRPPPTASAAGALA